MHVSPDWCILTIALVHCVRLCAGEAEVRTYVSTQKMLYADCKHAAVFALACAQSGACLM